MPPEQVTDILRIFMTDPILLIGSLLPIILLGGILIYRIRVSRRFVQLTKQNSEALGQNALRWQAAAARTEKMIELLTEIRDHMARIAPDAPELPDG
ncbi:MAG TPA: hypothetical protein VHY79_08400 [Rhizomicrobium sp.]|jgi:hypothetical protein|nr:hypothetical protein [Rhizomicrobium sp.]